MREYTPVTDISQKGWFGLMVKVYPAPHGVMGRHLQSIPLGSDVAVTGPHGRFSFNTGVGSITVAPSPRPIVVNRINVVAAGSGITPVFSLILHALKDCPASAKPQIRLIYCNRDSDAMLLPVLRRLCAQHPSHLRVTLQISSGENPESVAATASTTPDPDTKKDTDTNTTKGTDIDTKKGTDIDTKTATKTSAVAAATEDSVVD